MEAPKRRLLSLDVLRGITVAGMVMVNNQGSRDHFHALGHEAWNGMTPCDLVFPFFLFMVGVTTYIALRKADFHPSAPVVVKILRRTVVILMIGWGIHWFESVCQSEFFPFATLRLTGVLPRIALCYCLTAFTALYLRHQYIPGLIAALLAGYAAILLTGHGYNADESNLLGVVDRYVLGEVHLYHKSPIDPEGLVGTISSWAQTLIGFCCGKIVFGRQELTLRDLRLMVIGFLMLAVGFCAIDALPLNKHVWSPSFVLVSCGLCALLFGVLIWFIDLRRRNGWCPFFEIYGVNPLALYVLSELIAIVIGALHWKPAIYGAIYAVIPNAEVASAVYGLVFVALMGAIGYPLYKRGIYIKI